MTYKLRYSQFNTHSILIEWPAIIDENMLENVLFFKNNVTNNYNKQKVEVIHTYNSLLIIYDFTIGNINDEILKLKVLYQMPNTGLQNKALLWQIPVCYDEAFGEDIKSFSKEKGHSVAEIIELHSKPLYTVFFIGFLPGFLYLGGLDSKLFLNRKSTPNLNVKKGSVAIGGKQTGIYPQDSPGGWHIIGNSPIDLFNTSQDPPCEIKAGDKVKFIPINSTDYAHIIKVNDKSEYQLKPQPLNA